MGLDLLELDILGIIQLLLSNLHIVWLLSVQLLLGHYESCYITFH